MYSEVKRRVSRFGACASDNVRPIRSEYTEQAGYGGEVLQLAGRKITPSEYGGEVLQLAGIKIKLTGQCFGHVSERNRKAAYVNTWGFLQRFVQMSHDIQERPELMNLCERIRFYFSTECRSLAASTFFTTRGSIKAEKLSQTYVLKSTISSAFSDKLTIECSFDSLILLDQREGEEREICKLQEAMRPSSNNNTERPSEMLECI